MILFSVLMTDALTSKARPAAADQRAARSEFAGVRSAVSFDAMRVAKRRDILSWLALVRCASGKKVCCFVVVMLVRASAASERVLVLRVQTALWRLPVSPPMPQTRFKGGGGNFLSQKLT